jgi:hypothetical protein
MQQGFLNTSLAAMISNTTVAWWPELIEPQHSQNVQVEYHRDGPDQPIRYLKVWAAGERRGEWRLVCNYPTTSDAGSVGAVAFCTPFHSVSFAHVLTAVLENQHTFADFEEQAHGVLLQISAPNADERTFALAAVQTALAQRGMSDREVSAQGE